MAPITVDERSTPHSAAQRIVAGARRTTRAASMTVRYGVMPLFCLSLLAFASLIRPMIDVLFSAP